MKSQFNASHLLPCASVLLLTAACGVSSGPPANVESRPGAVPLREVSIPEGDLSKTLAEIQTSKYLDACDVADAQIKKTMVEALEIYLRNPNKPEPGGSSPEVKLIPFHNSNLMDLPRVESKNPG